MTLYPFWDFITEMMDKYKITDKSNCEYIQIILRFFVSKNCVVQIFWCVSTLGWEKNTKQKLYISSELVTLISHHSVTVSSKWFKHKTGFENFQQPKNKRAIRLFLVNYTHIWSNFLKENQLFAWLHYSVENGIYFLWNKISEKIKSISVIFDRASSIERIYFVSFENLGHWKSIKYMQYHKWPFL